MAGRRLPGHAHRPTVTRGRASLLGPTFPQSRRALAMPPPPRRSFLAHAAAASGLLGLARTSRAIDPIPRTRPSHFKLSLAAYSYRRYLAGPEKRMDLFAFVDLAADLGLDAVEPTAYYFPEDAGADYCHRLRRHAFLRGLDISGTAIRNDFCLPPGPERDRELARARAWIDRASELSAPTLRLLS